MIELDLDTLTVPAERIRVNQILDNLIVNALKYACDVPQPRITIGSRMADGEVRLFVRDEGPGVAEENQNRIFDLFQQLDSSQAGSGVGLAIVRRIMDVHRGRTWVESNIGEGTTFWLAFPSQVEDLVGSR